MIYWVASVGCSLPGQECPSSYTFPPTDRRLLPHTLTRILYFGVLRTSSQPSLHSVKNVLSSCPDLCKTHFLYYEVPILELFSAWLQHQLALRTSVKLRQHVSETSTKTRVWVWFWKGWLKSAGAACGGAIINGSSPPCSLSPECSHSFQVILETSVSRCWKPAYILRIAVEIA